MSRQIRMDNWSNRITGAGTAIDSTIYDAITPSTLLTDPELETLYHENGLVSRICNIYPEDSLKQGFDVELAKDEVEPGQIDDIKNIEKDLKNRIEELSIVPKTIDALVWANVFGGAVMLLGVDDGAMDDGLKEPLDLTKIKSFSHVTVLDKRYITPNKWYDDPFHPKFGTPEIYYISSLPIVGVMGKNTLTQVHETRLCVFNGVRTSILRRQRNSGWQESYLQRVIKAIRKFDTSYDDLRAILSELSVSVVKIDGYIDALASNDQGTIDTRVAMMNMFRSLYRSVVLDAEKEEYESKAKALPNIEHFCTILQTMLCTVTGIPATKLFGKAPDGMNATGYSDMNNWYDELISYQTYTVKPIIEYLVKVMLSAQDGPTKGQEPENWTITFPSLRIQNEKEEAETRKLIAETDAIYIDRDVILPEEAAVNRFSPAGWSPDTTIDIEARMALRSVQEKLEEADSRAQNAPIGSFNENGEPGEKEELEENEKD